MKLFDQMIDFIHSEMNPILTCEDQSKSIIKRSSREFHEENLMKRLRKWRIMFASGLVVMLDYGFLYTMGTLFIPLIDKFQESRVKVAAVQSTLIGVHGVVSVFAGLVVSKWGAHNGILISCILIPSGFFLSYFAKSVFHLYVTQGVMAGAGNSFVFVSCSVAVGEAFPSHQRSILLSLQMALIGVSNILYPYFLNWAVADYGVGGTFLLQSAIYLHTFIAAVVFRYERKYVAPLERYDKKQNDMDGSKDKVKPAFTNDTAKLTDTGQFEGEYKLSLCSYQFCIFVVGSALLMGTMIGFITTAQDIFKEKKLSNTEILTGFLTFNICNTIGRLAPGICSKFNVSCFVLSLLASLCGVIGQMVIFFTSKCIPVIVGSGLAGAALGGFASSGILATFALLGPNKQAIGIGIILTLNSITANGIGPIYGKIRDVTGSYRDVLLIAICLDSVSFVLVLVVLILNSQLCTEKPDAGTE